MLFTWKKPKRNRTHILPLPLHVTHFHCNYKHCYTITVQRTWIIHHVHYILKNAPLKALYKSRPMHKGIPRWIKLNIRIVRVIRVVTNALVLLTLGVGHVTRSFICFPDLCPSDFQTQSQPNSTTRVFNPTHCGPRPNISLTSLRLRTQHTTDFNPNIATVNPTHHRF